MFEGGKTKALTLSYDDGVKQDRRLVGLLNRYGVKCTFNLNSGIQTEANVWVRRGVTIRRMNCTDIGSLFDGHEIAVHTLSHPHLENLPLPTVVNEVLTDRRNLENALSVPVHGMAYPFGTYNSDVLSALRTCGIQYARTTRSTHAFALPEDLLELHPTCHHNDPRLFELAEEFLSLAPDTPQVFYLWGHSYEFDTDDNWNRLERFLSLIAGREDIFYGTNSEVFTACGLM